MPLFKLPGSEVENINTVNFTETVYGCKTYREKILKLFFSDEPGLGFGSFVQNRSWISIQKLCLCQK